MIKGLVSLGGGGGGGGGGTTAEVLISVGGIEEFLCSDMHTS